MCLSLKEPRQQRQEPFAGSPSCGNRPGLCGPALDPIRNRTRGQHTRAFQWMATALKRPGSQPLGKHPVNPGATLEAHRWPLSSQVRAASHATAPIEFYLIASELKPWPGQRWENKQGDEPARCGNGSRERLVWHN